MTRAAPFGMIVAGLFALDVAIYLGLPIPLESRSTLSDMVPLLVLPLGVAGGFAYGSFLAALVTKSLGRTGAFRATRRQLIGALMASMIFVAVRFWFIDLYLTILRPLTIGVFSSLASMFAAQSIGYVRWEHRTGKRVEYEGAWGVKAVGYSSVDVTPDERRATN
jgi:hypothetical protein